MLLDFRADNIGMEQALPKTPAKDIRIRVTVFLQRDDGKICFVRHLKNGKRYWLLPGGGQDPFETAKEAASRELMEELKITVSDYELLFVRESMNKIEQRHIQFLVFKGINPDFSTLETGEDPRVEGIDFFSPEEMTDIPIYPSMKEDIIQFVQGEMPERFKSLTWIP